MDITAVVKILTKEKRETCSRLLKLLLGPSLNLDPIELLQQQALLQSVQSFKIIHILKHLRFGMIV